jgi:hypothetical protein
MSELRDRFRTLERVQTPDLRDDILLRARAAPQGSPRSRAATAAVALLLSATTLAFLTLAFREREPLPPAANWTEIEAIVEGVRLSWPSSWTLVQLSERSPDEHRWPMFQLTNFDPGLEADSLCPFSQELPDDGVALYIQRDFDPIAESYEKWPVEVDPDAITDVGCDRRTTAAWSVGDSLFQASLAFGPMAREEDRTRLLRVFTDLEVVDTRADGLARRLDSRSRNTWYVAWGVRSDDPELAATYLVGDDPDPRPQDRPERIVALNGSSFGFGWGPFDFDQTFHPLGDSKGPDRSFVQSWGVVSPSDVARVVLEAQDGREVELTIGPPLDRYGIPGRPTYAEFEPPLLGEYVALGPDGEVLGRRREANWPPDSAAPPSTAPPTPSPQAEEQVWLPDAEAERNREAIESAIDGPVLARGNNWNYPWVVYVSAEGKLTYRDADSISPLARSASHFRGTRYSFAPDPEVLFVGVANQRVAWFGVEGKDGRSIAGSIVPVPDSDLLLVHLTVLRPQSGDRLVARDESGRILHEEPLERESGTP